MSPAVTMSLKDHPSRPAAVLGRGPRPHCAGAGLQDAAVQKTEAPLWALGANLVIKRVTERTRTPLPEPATLKGGWGSAGGHPGDLEQAFCRPRLTPSPCSKGPSQRAGRTWGRAASVVGGDQARGSEAALPTPSIQPARPSACPHQPLRGVGLSGDLGNCPQRRGLVVCVPHSGRGQSRAELGSQASGSDQAWSGEGPRAASPWPGVKPHTGRPEGPGQPLPLPQFRNRVPVGPRPGAQARPSHLPPSLSTCQGRPHHQLPAQVGELSLLEKAGPIRV